MTSKVRCPKCQKAVADSLDGKAEFTCPRCKTQFSVVIQLTKTPDYVMVNSR